MNFFDSLKPFSIDRNSICRVETIECIEKSLFDSLSKDRMRCKCRNRYRSFFSRISTCFHECPARADMIIDDKYLSSFEISSFEIHFEGRGSCTHFCTGDDFIVSKESRKCLLCSCIRKEDYGFLCFQNFSF